MATTTLPEKYLGTFKLEKSEKFDEFLAAKKVPWMIRKAISMAKSTKVISKNDDGSFTFATTSFRTTTWVIRLGEPMVVDAMDQTKHRVTFSVSEDESLIEDHVHVADESNKDGSMRWFIDENGYLIAEMKAGDLVCKRYYKRA